MSIYMKRLILLMTVIFLSLPLLVTAQDNKKWGFGISAELGRDYFDRKYPSEYDKYPGLPGKFQSKYSWGVGSWVERHLNARFSAIARIGYSQKDMDPNDYGQPSRIASKYFTKEKHHSVITDLGARWYINPKSALKMFIDVKAGANALIAIDIYEVNDGKFTYKEIFGYNRWQPAAVAAIGVNWKRLALSLEYNRDLKRAENPSTSMGIGRQGLNVKTSFAVSR